jgi:hypothetical protein
MSVVQIYQFCRAFDNVRYSEVYGCYVSGGYAFEKIARASHEVPPEIREAVIAVINDYFKLNDNYPPEKDDFALIAREIDDKYSVLAVANRQLDDGGRPTIGYKYFWLEKSSPDVDGIGTLIYWWSNHKEPKFDMAELVETSLPEIFYYDLEYQKTNFQEPWLQETWKTVEKLPAIPHTVVVTKELWQQEYPEYIKLHYLALGLSFRANDTNSPNAWAWNVQKLAHPDSFISIFYATQEDRLSNIRNIRKRNLPALNLVSPQTHNPDDPTPDEAQPESRTPLPSKTPNSIPSAVTDNIKSCLSSLANTYNQNRLNRQKTQQLFGYLRDYADADWTECIDKTTLGNASSIHDIYPQLIYLIAPNNKSSKNWLLKMVQSLELDTQQTSSGWISTLRNWANPSESNNQAHISEFQRVLLEDIDHLEASYDQDNSFIYNKLKDSMYYGISFLLDKLINPEVKVMAQKIDYLLTRSQGIWQEYFKKYTEIIAQVILYKKDTNYPSVITFCQPILDIRPNLKNTHERNRRSLYGKYQNLAIIFSKTHRKDLAEFFYRMSGNKEEQIPQDVRTALHKDIRAEIFGEHNQRVSPTTERRTQVYDNQEDTLPKSILGFMLFVVGSIFFYRIDAAEILIRVILLVMSTVGTIYLTGNPFNRRSNNIGPNISWAYIFIATAFLVVGTHSKTPNISSTDCSVESLDLFQNYQTYTQCYLPNDEETKKQKLQKFLPDINSPHKDAQLKKVIDYIDDITNEPDLNRKIAKLNECKTGNPNDFGNCLKPPSASKPSPQPKNKQCLLDTWENSKKCKGKLDQQALKIKNKSFQLNQIQVLEKYLLSDTIKNNEEFQNRKEKAIQCLKEKEINKFNQCLNAREVYQELQLG